MANDCCFEMHVSGKKENVGTFLTWMTATYDYREENKGIKVYKYNELDDELKTLIEEAISRGEEVLTICDSIEDGGYKWKYILY